MALIQYLYVNRAPIAMMDMRRLQELDLSDMTTASDAVSDYEVSLEGKPIGTLQHRYGDGPFVLAMKANELVVAWMKTRDIDPLSEDWRG